MVYIFCKSGFEEIEALAVVDILRRCDIEIKIASDQDEIEGSHGIRIKADCTLDDVNLHNTDMIILPGGPGTSALEQNDKIQQIIKHCVDAGKWIAAICAAPGILGKKGYLYGKAACCFPGYQQYLIGAHVNQQKVTVDGNFITAKGAGCAHDFAFAIAEKLKDAQTAANVRSQMQYD